MSDLRDARLRRALDSAPDADLRPDQRTRKAVLETARKAVAPAPPSPWWATLWQGMGNRTAPWNAALATVVIATMVTVLWYDRDVPGARPEVAPTREPAPAVQPPAAPSPAQPPAAAAPPPAAAPARKAAPAAKPQPQPAPASQQAESARERRAEVAADALRDQEVRELAKSGPSPQSAEPAKQADIAAAARAPAAPAAAPAMSRAAPAGLASQAEPPFAADWTHLRIAAEGRSVELARERAPRLARLLNAMTREAQSQQPLETPVSLRIELMREAESAGVIELAGPQVRWTPAGRSGSFTARPDEARLQALQEEIGQLLQR